MEGMNPAEQYVVAQANAGEIANRDRDAALFLQVRDSVNAMLLNGFLKAHWRMEEQDASIAKQQKQSDALTRGLRRGQRTA